MQVKRPDLEEAAAGVVSFVLLTTDFVWVRLDGTGQNVSVPVRWVVAADDVG